jgi:hypothetical protein
VDRLIGADDVVRNDATSSQGLIKHTDGGTPFFAYGGDFGDHKNDKYVCLPIRVPVLQPNADPTTTHARSGTSASMGWCRPTARRIRPSTSVTKVWFSLSFSAIITPRPDTGERPLLQCNSRSGRRAWPWIPRAASLRSRCTTTTPSSTRRISVLRYLSPLHSRAQLSSVCPDLISLTTCTV